MISFTSRPGHLLEPRLMRGDTRKGFAVGMKAGVMMAAVVILATLACPVRASAQAIPDGLLWTASLDDDTDITLRSGLVLPSDYSRPSPALDAQGRLVQDDQPRWASGRFGQSLYLEAGDHGEFARGMRNLLRDRSTTGKSLPQGFSSVQGATLTRDATHAWLPDGASVRVAADRAGQGVATEPVDLPQPMRYIASAYVKGQAAGQTVELVIHDPTNDVQVRQAIPLTDQWQRVHVVLPYDERKQEHAGKKLDTPAGVTVSVIAQGPGVFHVDALMLEQSGVFYTNRLTPSTWVPGGVARAFEHWRVPVTKDTFHAQAGTIVTWVRLDEGTLTRHLISAGNGWTLPLRVGQQGNRLSLQMGKATGHAPALEAGKWHHLALSWQGDQARLHVDGKQAISVTSKDYDPAWFDTHHAFVMVGSTHGNGGFSARTALQGRVDDVVAFDRALSDDQILTLAERSTPLASRTGLQLRLDTRQRVFGRDMTEVPIRLTLLHADGPQAGPVRLTFRVGDDLHTHTAGPVTLDEHGRAQVVYPFPAGLLMPGSYDVQVQSQGMAPVTLPLKVAPWRDPHRLPVVAWGYGVSLDDLAKLAEAGFTAAPTGLNPLSVDRAAELGMDAMAQFRYLGEPRWEVPDDRIQLYTGKYSNTQNPASEHIQQDVRRAAERFAEALDDLPGITQVIVNTEWNPPMGFNEPVRREAKEKFGIDMADWMTDGEESWRNVNPYNRLSPVFLPKDKQQPADGIVPEDDPFYALHRWWHHGVGNEVGLNHLAAGAIHERHPEVTRAYEPILRAPSIVRYQDMDIAQEWFYYNQPRTAIWTQERLAFISRGLKMRPSGMPQFLIKQGRGAGPFDFVPPPDLMRETFWLVASRPLDQMSLWGWHRALGDESTGYMTREALEKELGGLSFEDASKKARELRTKGLYIPELKDHMADYARTVWRPHGKLMRHWDNAPRRIAMIQSFATELYGNQRWHFPNWMYQAITDMGMPHDILWDDAFLQGGDPLADYRVVVLTSNRYLPAQAVAALEAFARRGGLIVADDVSTVKIDAPVRRFEEAQAGAAARLVRDRARLPIVTTGSDVFWNLLTLDGAHYLVVVNDRREKGPYLGPWGDVKEKGMAHRTSLRIDPAVGQYAYDLLAEGESREPHRVEAGQSWQVELPAAGARLFALTSQPVERLEVNVAQPVIDRGQACQVTIRLQGPQGPVDVAAAARLELIRPDGQADDLSRQVLLRHGEATADLLLPLNAPTGRWGVRVTEPLTGRSSQASFEVR